jgi:hypothetical protein
MMMLTITISIILVTLLSPGIIEFCNYYNRPIKFYENAQVHLLDMFCPHLYYNFLPLLLQLPCQNFSLEYGHDILLHSCTSLPPCFHLHLPTHRKYLYSNNIDIFNVPGTNLACIFCKYSILF